MSRFVLLYHDCPPSFGKPSHWDLMLQRDGALMTWSMADLPEAWQSGSAPENSNVAVELRTERIADHRLAYLDYEGPISENRGMVSRRDAGEYELVEETADWLHVQLRGNEVRGVVALPIAPATSAPA